eukprot:GHVL01014519.1.p1 GENE.GHVL01014519.1~~GHVL01014519.1.p1  ORF type:complete len:264 (+),score=17.27 GHVL01014519.1:60-851(+)
MLKGLGTKTFNHAKSTQTVLAFFGQIRTKMVRRQSYVVDSRASPHGQNIKPHLGIKVTSANYISRGQTIVKQRRYYTRNPFVTRNRHFKIYPGENVVVVRNTSLVSTCAGRVKYTHHIGRDLKIINVIPQARDELLREDAWRYRTEHVTCMEENRQLIYLRMKDHFLFPLPPVNPVVGPGPRLQRFHKRGDHFNNMSLENEYYTKGDKLGMQEQSVAVRSKKKQNKLWDQEYLKGISGLDAWKHEGINTWHPRGNARRSTRDT